MTELTSAIIAWYMTHLNYWTIALLMAIEGSFIPFPSEIVVPPAAYKAANGELNFILVIVSATIGALIGSLFNYFLAKFLGRPIIYKLADSKVAKVLFLNAEKIEQSEQYFLKNGNMSTLIGRLLPGIRQLISIPAGFAKMNLKSFILYTTIGTLTWNLVLGIIGYYSFKLDIAKYIGYFLLAGVIILITYLVYKAKFKK
jgi:membrane protein DedA with SNARE-associated domain